MISRAAVLFLKPVTASPSQKMKNIQNHISQFSIVGTINLKCSIKWEHHTSLLTSFHPVLGKTGRSHIIWLPLTRLTTVYLQCQSTMEGRWKLDLDGCIQLHLSRCKCVANFMDLAPTALEKQSFVSQPWITGQADSWIPFCSWEKELKHNCFLKSVNLEKYVKVDFYDGNQPSSSRCKCVPNIIKTAPIVPEKQN